MGSGARLPVFKVQTSAHADCVTLSKVLILSMPQLPQLEIILSYHRKALCAR